MKGRAAVDALCPIAKTSHVYEEEDDIWDCMLNQVHISFTYPIKVLCQVPFFFSFLSFLKQSS